MQSAKQEKFDRQYLRIAQIISERSYAKRKKVGTVIVKGTSIISDGYNGTPSGFENRCENILGLTLPHVLHSEANAIMKLTKSTISSEGATLYCTWSPCLSCAKLIVQAGIKRVVLGEDYRKKEGVELLREAGIDVLLIENV